MPEADRAATRDRTEDYRADLALLRAAAEAACKARFVLKPTMVLLLLVFAGCLWILPFTLRP